MTTNPKEDLVTVMKRIYQAGMTTLSGGNLSIHDEDGSIWITPAGLDKGSLTPDDIVCVRPDGTLLGAHSPSSEMPSHEAVYAARPDLRAITHAHPPAIVAFSIAHTLPEPRILPAVAHACGPVGYAGYALPGTDDLGALIGAAFADGPEAVLLENHGIMTAGLDLMTAYRRMEALERAAQVQILARTLGEVTDLSDEQLDLAVLDPIGEAEEGGKRPKLKEKRARRELAAMIRRAWAGGLMLASSGAASARAGKGGFVITAPGADFPAMTSKALRRVEIDGPLEGHAQHMHAAIYAAHPEVGCIIDAHPAHITAFAVTGTRLDTRSIPESYFLLVDMPLIPLEMAYGEPETVAQVVSMHVPVALVQNDGVLVLGTDPLNALDRLEVAEFSARSMLNTYAIGPMQPISDEDVRKLREKYL